MFRAYFTSGEILETTDNSWTWSSFFKLVKWRANQDKEQAIIYSVSETIIGSVPETRKEVFLRRTGKPYAIQEV